MHFTPENAEIILRLVDDLLKKNESAPVRLNKLWWHLLFSRARQLASGLREIVGDKVYDGPFKGMLLIEEALRIYHAPVLLGCYEQELHAVFEHVIGEGYGRVVNVGCSVGYYAVGLARRLPEAIVEAFDIDADARKNCAHLAERNGVADRLRIGGQFYGEDFEKYAAEKTLFLVDIEGAEKELLNPARHPALQKADLIVEMHDYLDSEISKTLRDRFAATHDIEIIKNRAMLPDMSGLVSPDMYVDPLDHFLLAWEGRDGPTPWGVFKKKPK